MVNVGDTVEKVLAAKAAIPSVHDRGNVRSNGAGNFERSCRLLEQWINERKRLIEPPIVL